MRVRLPRYHGNSVSVLTLERKLVPEVLAALTPSHYDWYPAKWQVLGELDIELKNGSRCAVDLYETSEELAAFSIDGRDYRGGSDRDLVRLLRQRQSGGRNGRTDDESRK